MNEVIELLHRHRSVRHYTEDPVPEEHLREAVRAGQAASTSSAVQSYSVIHVTDDAARQALVGLTGEQAKVARAGAFLVICGDARRHQLAATEEHPYTGHLEAFLLTVIDASLFAQNLCVAVESMGYGICYIGGIRNHLFDVDRLLELPQGVYPLYGLCIGRPDEAPLPRPRLGVDAVLFKDRYPDDDRMREMMAEYDDRYRAYLDERGAEPRAWSTIMSRKYGHASRPDLARYYASKGARLD